MPLIAISDHSSRVRGQRTRRIITSELRISEARTKRIPAKVVGGRSFKPILMKSQVDPQMPQRINQTMRAFISQLYVSETEWSKRESLNAKAAEDFANVSEARPSGRAR